ncbi:MAG TPA: DUF4276 family protein [Chitinophagales bacterium]|nr:DUF4276 family protein [Chitinophagales bacterium]
MGKCGNTAIWEECVMGDSVVLFIEGDPNSPNGDLRYGFAKLLEKKAKGNMPKIILSGSKQHAIEKFFYAKRQGLKALLLIDLDKPETQVEQDMLEYRLNTFANDVFYMIQEMEAWFLSQPDILDSFFGKDMGGAKISKKIPSKKTTQIMKPSELLRDITRQTTKGGYHKIKHAFELLRLLDAEKLENDIPEFRRLIRRINFSR